MLNFEKKSDLEFLKQARLGCALENQQSPFYVVYRDSLSQDYVP